MAIRISLLIALIGCATGVCAAPIKRYPLDDRRVYALTVSLSAPTTVLFPGPIEALDGAGVSTRPEDNPGILISHETGTPYFTLRALRENATGAINVLYAGHAYALAFSVGTEPDRTLTFYPPSERPPNQANSRAEQLLSLLDRTKHAHELSTHYPALMQGVEHRRPDTASDEAGLRVTVTEAFHYFEPDALVLKVRLENPLAEARSYDPAKLAVQVADIRYPVAITDASGTIPAGFQVTLWLAVTSQADGTPARLSLKNNFRVRILCNE
ncbi:MAG: hypothetical protein H7A44_08510 [Opitutaceae bacterium]|nr:hypothetical protein [Cephaloticoccus sp.]MCP5530472.1 hypothetical protein [Opitutaceae bacterium]